MSATAALRVLVVDDCAPFAAALAERLAPRGHKVRMAGGGLAGLEAAEVFQPDVVLLNPTLPGMGGFEFSCRLRQVPGLAVVWVGALTAFGRGEHAIEELGRLLDSLPGPTPKPTTPAPGTPSPILWAGRRPTRRVRGKAMATPPTILVVDDEPALRAMLAWCLGFYRLTALTAASGPEALATFQRHRDAIGAVLLEASLPGGEGPLTLRVLRALGPEVVCLCMDAGGEGYTEEDLLRLGATRVFPKPFACAGVAQAVWQLAGSRV